MSEPIGGLTKSEAIALVAHMNSLAKAAGLKVTDTVDKTEEDNFEHDEKALASGLAKLIRIASAPSNQKDD
jgi:hypothetical protein